jgi:endo-1,4-beta-xylanase
VKRRRFLESLAAAALAPSHSSCVMEDMWNTEPFVEEPETQTLARAAATNGRKFGCAVNSQMLAYRSPGRHVALEQCDTMTAEWSFKWDRLSPAHNQYDFDDADHIANFARENGKRMRGHTLLWHLGLPPWADALIAETREWDNVRQYFNAVMPRYADIVDEWDVINEPIDVVAGADGLRGNQFLKAFGPDYIEWAFWSAHDAAPDSRLFINEYGLEYGSPEEGLRRLTLLRLLEKLVSRGVPVHGVGLQAHLDLRKGSVYTEGIYGLLRDISGMGLQISITELDIRERDGRRSLQERDRSAADEVRRYLDAVLDFQAVRSVTTWGLSDGDSWLTYGNDRRPDNRGLPYDRRWQRKPIRTAIETALHQGRTTA